MGEWKDKIREEISKGGSEAPCPFCGIPRVLRSDYIRCSRCGINWLAGEPLNKHPKTTRMQALIDNSKVVAMGRTTRK